jgi:hypothetical protein
MLKTAADRIVAALTGQRQPARVHLSRPARVRMDAQVLSQAPAGAMGYRLVLPPARAADRPRFSPLRRTDRPSFYTLSPFQAPEDLRLRDGRFYRLVFVDAGRRRMRCPPGPVVPGLYFFVGPPDGEAPALATEGPPVPTNASPKDDTVPLRGEVPSTTTEKTGASIEADPRPKAVDIPSASAPLEVPTAPPPPPPPTEPAQRQTVLPPLPAVQIQRLCAIIYDQEKAVQMNYEICSQLAVSRGEHSASEPPTDLSGEQRKELRRVVSDFRLFSHYNGLLRKFDETVQRDPAGPLPAPLQSLPATEHARAAAQLSNKECWAYANYLWNRWEALKLGRTVPAEPQSSLQPDVKRKLRKLLRDRRISIYLMYLARIQGTPTDPTSVEVRPSSPKI